ncbi:hypothetical protein WOC76_22745 [Methylocystis sp. IM3]|uniref:hypothetical protein n=1 Tax=unclassified Methylocystis TaxID=2625913 RepID=UPI000FB5365F|nr:MAG: hypothetical protein EKK29_20355 [Hyphomicrobiales bacterium]
MTKPLSAEAIFDQLRAMGLFEVEMSRDDISRGWRIRADGGPLVQICDNGNLRISGRKAHVLRKGLGLTGKRNSCCSRPKAVASENGDARLKKKPSEEPG